MGRKTWVELNLRSKNERDLRAVSDPTECCQRQDEVDLLQRELDDTTDRLVVSCLQRVELEKTVRTAADRIRELEARLGEAGPVKLASVSAVSAASTVTGNDVAIDVTDHRSVSRLPGAVRLVETPIAAPAERDDAESEPDRSDRRDGRSDNVYVFDDGDSVGEAFDEFFAAPDPHLDKIRRFLLG